MKSISSLKIASVSIIILLGAFTLFKLGMRDDVQHHPTSINSSISTVNTSTVAPVERAIEEAYIDNNAKPSPNLELVSISRAQAGRDFVMMRIHGAPPKRFVVGDTVLPSTRITKIDATSIQLQTASSYSTMTVSSNPNKAATTEQTKPTIGRVPEPSVITLPADQTAPSSNATERAIQRAQGVAH